MLSGVKSLLAQFSSTATEEETPPWFQQQPNNGAPYNPFTLGSMLVSRSPAGGRLGAADNENPFLDSDALEAGPSHLIFLEPSTFMACDCTTLCSDGCFHSVGTADDLRHAMKFHLRARQASGYTFTVVVAPHHWLEDATVLAFYCLMAERGVGVALDEALRITGREMSHTFVQRCRMRMGEVG